MSIRRPAGRDGFTLVELLVAISISGVVMSALAGAVFEGWRTISATAVHIGDTHSRIEPSTFWTRDVEDAGTVDVDPTNTSCTGGKALVVRMVWTDTSPAGTAVTRTVAYVRTTVGTDAELVRDYCDTAGAATTVVVAHNITAASVACTTLTGTATATCAGASTVALSVGDSAGASFTLTARRRSP